MGKQGGNADKKETFKNEAPCRDWLNALTISPPGMKMVEPAVSAWLPDRTACLETTGPYTHTGYMM
jgi:hypothetical protein